MALYPEDATLPAWTKISEAREFSGLSVVVFEALQARFGTLGDALRNVAILPANVWTGAIAAAHVSEAGERQLTPIEAAQAGLLWRLAKKAAFLQGGGSTGGSDRVQTASEAIQWAGQLESSFPDFKVGSTWGIVGRSPSIGRC